MTSGPERRLGGLHVHRVSDRRELVLTLVLGAAGAGLVFLASRQGWAQVETIPPRPLPASRVTVTGAALVPAADALALAGLATLAAVLASRRLARRLTGILLALIGASLAWTAFAVTSTSAISAANSNVGPTTAGAGSVMDGGSATSAVPNVAGTAPHVTFSAAGWQALVVVGALAVIAAGVLVVWRGSQMAVMSSRYDSPVGGVRRAGASRGRGFSRRPGRGQRAAATAATATAAAAAADSASMWEALSRGDDPTSGPSKITRAGSADSGSLAT